MSSNAMWNLIIISLIAYYAQIVYREWSRPVVFTEMGWVRGVKSDEGYYMYLGIPYAKVREENPFATSTPHPTWSGIFDANDITTICPHMEEVLQKPVGTVQCLNLHVHTPRNGRNLPVIVFIYGGQYRFGHAGRIGNYSTYIPDFLIQNDVIVVTFNFRSGVYGFFCLDTPEIPGNQGLKDQTLALQWVKKNIEHFGGDPNRITILGHSSGAMSTAYHVYANSDLFNRIILNSGSPFIPGGIREANVNKPVKIAKRLGHKATNMSDALKFLAKADVNLVVTASKDEIFRPCVEKRFAGVKGFLNVHPVHLKPDLKNKTILIGNTKREIAKEICLPRKALNSRDLVKVYLKDAFETNEHVLDKVKRYYAFNEKVTQNEYENNAMNFIDDLQYNYPTERAINLYLDNGANKIYQYVFAYSGDRNLMKVLRKTSNNATTHGDDLGYLFKMSLLDKMSESDQLIVDRMSLMWTNFAKYGDTTPETTNFLPVKWLPTTKLRRRYLIIDTLMRMDDTLLRRRMDFWHNLYETYAKYVKAGF